MQPSPAERSHLMDVSEFPAPLELAASGPHTHTCILLHGRGGNGKLFGLDFVDSKTADDKTLKQCFPGVKFIFPTAKRGTSKFAKRMRFNQWFDICSLTDPSKRDHLQVEGLRESTHFIHQIIRNEAKLIGAKHVILGGLSQGCASGLHIMLTFEETLGAFVGMSGWMPFQRLVNEIMSWNQSDAAAEGVFFELPSPQHGEGNHANKLPDDATARALNFLRENLSVDTVDPANLKCLRTPVFLGHGGADDRVSCSLGENIKSTLEALGMDVEWKLYPEYGHWYKIPDEIDDIRNFLKTKTSAQEYDLPSRGEDGLDSSQT